MPDRLYLDHNATSPLRPGVRDALIAVMKGAHNPSSTHSEGRAAKKILEDARGVIAETVRAPKEGVIFTGGGTEAINMALHGAVHGPMKVRRLMVSAIEHDAVKAAAEGLADTAGVTVETVPVTRDGVIDLEWLADRLAGYDQVTEGAFLLAVMLANNETGVIQPVGKLGPLAWPKGGHVFVDAVQGFGKLPLDFGQMGVDMMSLGAHKVGGPAGVGALVIKPGLALAPYLRGGGQELSRRAGTENLIAIAGFSHAAKLARPEEYAELAMIRDRIESGLPDGVIIWGQNAPRLPNTSCFSAPGFRSETQVMVMDLGGIAISAGSACSSGKVRQSGVLGAMGASEEEANSAIRVSLGWTSTMADADMFLRLWKNEFQRIAERNVA
ncbi:cysteine desulfurase family protein [Parvularcula marina]|uniref:cysteine desulfurase family protein n=1 Tax=Parvularcula marina TaxID=2292771 RepID=UPI003518A579